MGFSISSAVALTVLLCFTSTSTMTIPNTSARHDISVDNHDFQYQNNWVFFDSDLTLEGTYTITKMSISPGQDPDRLLEIGTVLRISSDGLLFQVGRHGTRDVANDWNSWLPMSSNTFQHPAGVLNFAFLGTLEVEFPDSRFDVGANTITFDNIGIAQGHTGRSNNWWFAAGGFRTGDRNQIETRGHVLDVQTEIQCIDSDATRAEPELCVDPQYQTKSYSLAQVDSNIWTWRRGDNGDDKIRVNWLDTPCTILPCQKKCSNVLPSPESLVSCIKKPYVYPDFGAIVRYVVGRLVALLLIVGAFGLFIGAIGLFVGTLVLVVGALASCLAHCEGRGSQGGGDDVAEYQRLHAARYRRYDAIEYRRNNAVGGRGSTVPNYGTDPGATALPESP